MKPGPKSRTELKQVLNDSRAKQVAIYADQIITVFSQGARDYGEKPCNGQRFLPAHKNLPEPLGLGFTGKALLLRKNAHEL